MFVGVIAIVMFVIATPGVASANDKQWDVRVGGQVWGAAEFDDAANRVYVHDLHGDGRATVMDIWRVGNHGGQHVTCRADKGVPGEPPENNNCPLIWVEDTHLKGQLCLKGVGGPTVCSAVKEFYS